jgi:hypothetical protein
MMVFSNEFRSLNRARKTIWEQEVAGSNPVAPTINTNGLDLYG